METISSTALSVSVTRSEAIEKSSANFTRLPESLKKHTIFLGVYP